MTKEEAIQIAYDMGAHPYSVAGMVECLLKGVEMGKAEQKAIDEAEIKELKAIVELTASVMGIGTKWFSEAARMDATIELREKIIKYCEKEEE